MENGCSFCRGPFHSATGCEYGARIRACYSCTVDFWTWVRSHTNGKARLKARDGRSHVATSVSFYEAAGRR